MAKTSPLSLKLARRWRCVEEFTLLEDKVRVDSRKPFSNTIVEIPLRFLDPTWAIQKGSSHFRYLILAALLTITAATLGLHAASVQPNETVAGLATVLWVAWFFGTPLAILAWWKGRYNVIIFTTLHPNYGNLVIARDADKDKELDILQFADAVSERIKLLQLTKPDG